MSIAKNNQKLQKTYQKLHFEQKIERKCYYSDVNREQHPNKIKRGGQNNGNSNRNNSNRGNSNGNRSGNHFLIEQTIPTQNEEDKIMVTAIVVSVIAATAIIVSAAIIRY